MKHTIAALALLTLGASALAAEMTEEQKTFYALGQIMGRQTSVFAMTPAELEMVKQGIGDAVEGRKPAVDMDVYGPKVSTLAQSRRAALVDKQAKEGEAFADAAAKEKGAVKTASGLVFIPLV
ncbi:MAG: FKBP-type peptidyl-prolyl cis-trans isomerase N-terminal domain-containing protein, partial [Bryobacterales bacterium]|nr:FKBP-type peptidyl-prolyl cis-trans isomerase N-terminal domain-containing protein [Bryobacterales bacterium]